MDNALTSQSSQTPTPSANWDAANLIAEHQTGIWRYLRSIGCDHTLADDLTQETFIAVIRRPFIQVSPAATSSYLRRVAYHLLISYRRRQKKVSTTCELSILDSQWLRWAGDTSEGSDDVIDALVDCFARLTERAQLSLRMRFANDASREAIAEQLGITEHGAKNLMQRAKAQLKQCLDGKVNRE